MSLFKLQKIFRLKRKNYQNFAVMKAKIVGIIKNIKFYYNYEFMNKQLREDVFYEVQSKLDAMLEYYSEVVSLYEMSYRYFLKRVRGHKQNMEKVRDIIRIYGCDFETIFMVENITFPIDTDYEIIDMLKSTLYSTSYKIMDTNESQPESEIHAIEQLRTQSFHFSNVDSSIDELINQCYSTRVYFKLKDSKVLCIDGIFCHLGQSSFSNHVQVF